MNGGTNMSIYKEQFDKLHTSVTAEKVIAAANAKSYRKRINKAIAIPVALAAAMSVLVVSVGAACNWDFRSLILTDYTRNRHETAELAVSDIYSNEQLFMYGDSVTAPEGLREFHEMTEKELELLDRISVDVDQTFKSDDYDYIINWIMYDGYMLRVSPTIVNNSGVYDQHTDDNIFFMELDIKGEDDDDDPLYHGMGSGLVNGIEGDRTTWNSVYTVTFPENIDKFTIIVNKRGETVNGFTPYPEFGRVTIDIPDVSGLSQTYKLDEMTRLGNYGTSHLNMVRFSPFGVYENFDFNLSGDIKDINSVHVGYPPVYITMNDGTVIGLQNVFGNCDGRGFGKVNEDGSFNYGWQISQENYLIDAFDIASVQIGDCTIELDDSMIIEE